MVTRRTSARLVAAFVAVVATMPAFGLRASGSPQVARRLGGSWVGTYSLGVGGRAAIGVTVVGRGAAVALGTGHATVQHVRATVRGSRLRFAVPGSPTSVAFDGRLRKRAIHGVVRQGRARGTFSLRRGRASALVARGFYARPDGHQVAVVDDPYGPPRLVDLDTGEVHGLFATGDAFDVGSGYRSRAPVVGRARFDTAGAILATGRATRLAVRQLEVRFPARGATLAGTLTMPPGSGRHPAVAFVHGSGPTERAYLPDLQAALIRGGVAVLAYDKRGTGQSGGAYPGESPTTGAIDVLARDAEAAARFLASRREIDGGRVGLAGHSQAGWIAPLAASRESAVRFLVLFSGPAVTADETDTFQNLTGSGEAPAALTDEEIERQVAVRGPGGVDPMPSIAALRIPAIWIYGGLDRHIPARLSASRLEPLTQEPGRDVRVVVFPNANHALVETQTGLTAEMLRSDRFAPRLFEVVREWLAARLARLSGSGR